MASINDPKAVQKLLKADGWHPGDCQLHSIWSYNNIFNGEITFSLCYTLVDEMAAKAGQTPNLTLLWSRSNGLSPEGTIFLEDFNAGN